MLNCSLVSHLRYMVLRRCPCHRERIECVGVECEGELRLCSWSGLHS
jgi:hypothetical protein